MLEIQQRSYSTTKSCSK